jgi:hypothetical protein
LDITSSKKFRPTINHEKEPSKGFRWAWVLNITLSKKMGQQRAKRRAVNDYLK